MSDVIDQACGLETKFTEVALANLLARAQQTHQGKSAYECGECGDPIPGLRRQKVPGCQYCTPCQAARE